MKNDFESILSRLKDGIQGSFSTMEGTFAGDILQATAAELARIWSQEVDTVTQRGFVMTAEGEWLDAVCGNYGIQRKAGESDGQLRARTLEYIRHSGSSGNVADYQAWTLSIEGTAAARAVPLARGNGTVDVYFIPREDAQAGLRDRIAEYLQSVRPVGADVSVMEATEQKIAVTAVIQRSGQIATGEIESRFGAALADYLAGIRLTDGGKLISKNRLISLLMGCDGVADVNELKINGSAANLTLAEGRYASVQSVTITEG